MNYIQNVGHIQIRNIDIQVTPETSVFCNQADDCFKILACMPKCFFEAKYTVLLCSFCMQ